MSTLTGTLPLLNSIVEKIEAEHEIVVSYPRPTDRNVVYMVPVSKNNFTKITMVIDSKESSIKFFVEWCDDKGVAKVVVPEIVHGKLDLNDAIDEIAQLIMKHPWNM